MPVAFLLHTDEVRNYRYWYLFIFYCLLLFLFEFYSQRTKSDTNIVGLILEWHFVREREEGKRSVGAAQLAQITLKHRLFPHQPAVNVILVTEKARQQGRTDVCACHRFCKLNMPSKPAFLKSEHLFMGKGVAHFIVMQVSKLLRKRSKLTADEL